MKRGGEKKIFKNGKEIKERLDIWAQERGGVRNN